jgi:hypothetical protein
MSFTFIKITVPAFVRSLLPPHKRQPTRLSWLNALTYPLSQLMSGFLSYRQQAIIRYTVTGQTISLQWYLNYLLDVELQRILIVNDEYGGFTVGLRREGPVVAKAFGLSSESPNEPHAIPLHGENPASLPFDFRVIIPTSVDPAQVQGIVNKYKLAGRSYDIKSKNS